MAVEDLGRFRTSRCGLATREEREKYHKFLDDRALPCIERSPLGFPKYPTRPVANWTSRLNSATRALQVRIEQTQSPPRSALTRIGSGYARDRGMTEE